jgi:uncharacterized protein (TIGR00255 family)
MIKSMTGYGKSTFAVNNKNYTIEIKSLNSKQIDINTKIPPDLRAKELILRNLINKTLQRGRVDLYIEFEYFEQETIHQINTEAVKNYYNQITAITRELNIKNDNELLSTILRLPETFKKEKTDLDETEWNAIEKNIGKALEMLNNYRLHEGKALQKDINNRIQYIHGQIEAINEFEESRIIRIRERLAKELEAYINQEKIDSERFEQEIIYYTEKLDITEEKVRLSNHCKYFLKTLEEDTPVGRKLSFICQEILREINTLGAKANDANIQEVIVKMKDELEKVKEQVMNVL